MILANVSRFLHSNAAAIMAKPPISVAQLDGPGVSATTSLVAKQGYSSIQYNVIKLNKNMLLSKINIGNVIMFQKQAFAPQPAVMGLVT